MNEKQAIALVQQTFKSAFDRQGYIHFLKDLLNEFDSEGARSNQGTRIPDKFQRYVGKLERVGKYRVDDHEIMLFIVYLKNETSLERARTMQRNFVAHYLQMDMKDAALVAFVSNDPANWRFSLIKMEYRYDGEKNKIKEEFTPAKRWSFLVGCNEASHTAQRKLAPIMADDAHNPTLSELEEAFNIEKVTKEFFEKYRELFIRTKQALDKAIEAEPATKTDFEAKGVDTVNFAKKLLGQIIFLYFLQKKGWFGVPRDASWGEGSRNFLGELFEKCNRENKNFFNDFLEPLFYEALRLDRSHDDHYYSRFNCKIPFLNGGLFDPMNNYDWVHADIQLPNELFHNQTNTKEGDEGDGILDIFDRYNFTVKEDEPFEKEVAIDPELLGKAYEKFNAIRPDNYDAFLQALKSGKKGDESKFNKQYGVYYTPREIVHYMCQQSLINYLYSELNPNVVSQNPGDDQLELFGNMVKNGKLDLTEEHRPMTEVTKKDIETLILRGEQIKEHDERVVAEGRESEAYPFLMPASIRQHAALIDQKLANIKICDPAVGSGAFPVGMMSEIVRARGVLRIYPQTSEVSETSEVLNAYDFKRACIENSLYGVDIDPGAVEIAKLRLWLSLIVDEDDIQHIKPLPNLDYKIVCGNSLIGFPDNWGSPIEKEIETLIHQHFNETNVSKKNELKTKIDEKIESRYKNSLRAFGYQVNFDFKTVFSEVFQLNGGFDVVIANPPYVRQEEIKELKPTLQKQFECYSSGADLYVYFFEKGIRLLRDQGVLVFISSNKYFRSGYGEKLRHFLVTKTAIRFLIDFGELPVFENAATFPAIILTRKANMQRQDFLYAPVKRLDYYSLDEEVKSIGLVLNETALKSVSWSLSDDNEQRILEKMRQVGISFDEYTKGKVYYGIKTGYDAAFIIDLPTKKHLISQDSKSKELIKHYVIGDDIRNYQINFKNRFLILIPKGWTNINAGKVKDKWAWLKSNYPAIAEHLEPHQKAALMRSDQGDYWWELRACSYYDAFEKPKIVYPEIARESRFAFDDNNLFCNKTTFIVPTKDFYLLGILNSRIAWMFLKKTCSVLGDPEKGGRLLLQYTYLKQLPIPNVEKGERFKIEKLADRILAAKAKNPQADTSAWEREIDALVYQLYGLTEEEIRIVEGE